MKGKRFRIVILVLILAVLAVLYFYYLNTKKPSLEKEEETQEISLVFKVINRNLEEKYPSTPRDVIEFMLQIQQCYYNEEYTEQELMELILQSRKIMDDELLSANPYNAHYENVSIDIKEKEVKGNKFVSYIISKNSEVEYTYFEERNYAKVMCNYYFKDKEGSYISVQEYILRKDPEGKWKILASDLVKKNE